MCKTGFTAEVIYELPRHRSISFVLGLAQAAASMGSQGSAKMRLKLGCGTSTWSSTLLREAQPIQKEELQSFCASWMNLSNECSHPSRCGAKLGWHSSKALECTFPPTPSFTVLLWRQIECLLWHANNISYLSIFLLLPTPSRASPYPYFSLVAVSRTSLFTPSAALSVFLRCGGDLPFSSRLRAFMLLSMPKHYPLSRWAQMTLFALLLQ